MEQQNTPEEELNLVDKQIPEINSRQWQQQFVELPEMSYENMMETLQRNEPIIGKKLPFIRWGQHSIPHTVVFKNCQITGILAENTTFEDKVELHNCLFLERVRLSGPTRSETHRTTFSKGLKVEDCVFKNVFILRDVEMKGLLSIHHCHFEELLCLDKSYFSTNVEILGPGKIAKYSAYLARFAAGLSVANYHIGIAGETAFDMNRAQLSGTLRMANLQIEGETLCKKAKLASQNDAWIVENSSLAGFTLVETIFNGGLRISSTQFSGEFLADIPRQVHGHKDGRYVLFNGDVAFLDCQFKEKCFFHGARFKQYFNVKNSTFAKGVNFTQAQFGQLLSFWETTDLAGMHFRKANFGGKVNFGKTVFGPKTSFNDASFSQEVNIFDTQVNGDIFFSDCYFASDFKVRSSRFMGGLNLQKITVDGDLRLSGIKVEDRFILTGSTISKNLIAPALSIGTWGSLAKVLVREETDLGGFRVGTKIDPKAASDTDKQKDDSIIAGSFYCDGSIFKGVLSMSGAKIQGNLSFEESNSYSEFDLTRMSIGHDLVLSEGYFRGIVNFSGTRCQNIINSFKAHYKEEVSFNAISCHKFKLSESSFDGGFTLRSAQIEDQLILNQVDVDGKADLYRCNFTKLFFRNFLVDYFLIRRKQLGEMISSEEVGNYKQAKNEYGILKQAFQNSNQFQDMDWAYYRFCRSNRKIKKASFRHPLKSLALFLDWLLLDLGFGYGTRPMNIAGVSLAVILIFAGIFYLLPQGITSTNGPLQFLSCSDAIYLSIVTFASMDYGDCYPIFTHWLKHLFAIEGVLGIFFVTLFVATISRKIIRA